MKIGKAERGLGNWATVKFVPDGPAHLLLAQLHFGRKLNFILFVDVYLYVVEDETKFQV